MGIRRHLMAVSNRVCHLAPLAHDLPVCFSRPALHRPAHQQQPCTTKQKDKRSAFMRGFKVQLCRHAGRGTAHGPEVAIKKGVPTRLGV